MTTAPATTSNPTIGLISLGCPKALVDSERIITKLRAEGYGITDQVEGADAVIVNTCGFIDSARAESFETIGEALNDNGRVIVTGCLGVEREGLLEEYPSLLAVTGPHQYEQVVAAVHDAVPAPSSPFESLVPPQGIKLTPRHYAYLKISEGCNNRCKFCIIPSLRGDLVSRNIKDVMEEAERLVMSGVKELLVVSQDTSAYGLDIKYQGGTWAGVEHRSHVTDLAKAMRHLVGARAQGFYGARLHYIYPYPHVDALPEIMADDRSGLLPYLDIPFQHAHPDVLRSMARPAKQDKVLERIHKWRQDCPDLSIRSTFIVGYPGETEEQFQCLLDWVREAGIDRAGCFQYEPVVGATSNELPNQVPDEIKEDRWHRFMQAQQEVSAERLSRWVGRTMNVLVDSIDGDVAIARGPGDAPEIDGHVEVDFVEGTDVGDIIEVEVTGSSEYDLQADFIRRL